jgi:hypothetical protein
MANAAAPGLHGMDSGMAEGASMDTDARLDIRYVFEGGGAPTNRIATSLSFWP